MVKAAGSNGSREVGGEVGCKMVMVAILHVGESPCILSSSLKKSVTVVCQTTATQVRNNYKLECSIDSRRDVSLIQKRSRATHDHVCYVR